MGRFEQRAKNSHQTGDSLGDADTALRIVTEELQIIQRTLLKSLQEDVKRLQVQKDSLTDDIQRLQTEKDDLQRGRQINEQQALVRQLGQVLANHISSQLNSSLEKLANQGIKNYNTGEVFTSENNESSQLPHQQENIEQIIGTLDDTLTITIRSLQQELKNYQNSLSQQLSRMQNQQQQGELILVELVSRLRQELERNTPDNSINQNLGSDSIFTEIQTPPMGGTPTIIQPDLPL